MNIATLSEKRYTCKVYDATRKIPEDKLQQIYTLLRNSPSSVNSQPWHYIIVSSDEVKKRMLPAIPDFNQNKIRDASHIVLFCAKTALGDEHITQVLEQEDRDCRFADEALKVSNDRGRRYFFGLNSKTPQDLRKWEEKQIYLSLGTLLLGVATLAIDATPIEGFDPAKLDELLDLSSKGMASVVVTALGYRKPDDFNAALPKSRLPMAELFTFL